MSIAKKLNIGRKLVAITLLSLVGMLITLFLFYQGLAFSLIQEKKFQSKKFLDAGISIIKHFHSLVSTEGLKKTDAQNIAIEALKSTKYGENGYFWINDSNGMLLMHPYSPELVGSILINTVDKKGNYVFRDFVKNAKKGGGYVEYYWPKPTNSKPFPKNSYVAYYEPWDWVVGTGLYLDDVQREIRNYAFSALGVVFVLTIILLLFTMSLTKKIMYQLESMAIRDPLTSLYTRRYLNESMDDLILRHERDKDKYLSVIFFDIDFFKKVNDTHGHSCGDEVLSIIGEIIRKTSRPDDICVRYGGEEFVVILLSEKKDASMHLAERIRSKSQEVVFTQNRIEFSVTLSAGIAIRENSELIDATLQRADEKLYKAKEKGRNCVVS